MARDDEASSADYERLRHHLLGRREPPAGQARSGETAPRPGADPATSQASPIPVLDWLLAVGYVVVRKLRRVPRSPMVRLHPKP